MRNWDLKLKDNILGEGVYHDTLLMAILENEWISSHSLIEDK